jgi:recombination protein RecA
VVKNKVAPPFREAEFDILFGEGISREGDVIDLGVILKIIDKSGSWLSYKGERLGQGREKVRELLRQNKDLLRTIENDIRVACTSKPELDVPVGQDQEKD